MLNSVQIVGNLTRKPELRYTQSGKAVCSLNIASNRSYKSGEEYKEDVCFVTAVVWGKRAENCSAQLHKGNPVLIFGRLQSRSWEKDGKKHYAIEIAVEDIQFIEREHEGTTQEEPAEVVAD